MNFLNLLDLGKKLDKVEPYRHTNENNILVFRLDIMVYLVDN